MRSIQQILPLLLIAQVVQACGPGVEEGSLLGESVFKTQQDGGQSNGTGNPPGDTDSEIQSDTSSSSHFLDAGDTEKCPNPLFDDTPMLTASDTLENGKYVSMGTNCLLSAAQTEAGSHLQVTFVNDRNGEIIAETVDETVPGTPADLTCHYNAAQEKPKAVVLVNDDNGSTIYKIDRALKIDRARDTWSLLFKGPRLSGINHLMNTRDTGYDKLCAFGNGVFCAEWSDLTDWEEVYPRDRHYNDVTIVTCDGKWCEVAVGPNGLVELKRDAIREVIETGVDDNLLTVTNNESHYTAAGENGVVLHGTADAPPLAFRPVPGKTIVSLQRYINSNLFMGATEDGTVFKGFLDHNDMRLCPYSHTLPTDAIDGTMFMCEVNPNFLVLTADHLIGPWSCRLIVIL
jgi:hypothetical protein